MDINKNQIKVLVTGVTGFIASHVLKLLLEQNYQVIGTVKSLKNEEKNKIIYDICPSKKDNLQLVEANLNDEQCWDKIMPGIDYVMHIASPFPGQLPKNENEIIKPAVNGCIYVLQAALKANVKKIIITSSVAAIYSGHKDFNKIFTEKEWSVPENSAPYEKSKHLAEKAAWNLWNKDDNNKKIQMTMINPSCVLGPTLTGQDSTSQLLVQKLLNNDLPCGIYPKLQFGIVDVRDVALAHIKAMELAEETNGKRYILSNESLWMNDIKRMLQEEFTKFDYSFPKFEVGKFVIGLAALFVSEAKLAKDYVGKAIRFDNSLSQKELKIQYTNIKQTVLDSAYSLIQFKQAKLTKKLREFQEKKNQQ